MLRAWGFNDDGQLGDGTTSDSAVPVTVKLPPGVTITSVRAGCHHTLALTSSGTVLAWGDNSAGQLGDGTTTSSSVPVRVSLPPGTKVAAIRAGCFHSLALTRAGKVLAWGANFDGELGNGTTSSSQVPVPVTLSPGTRVTAISAGDFHSLAVTSGGQALAWGFNGNGELGDGTVTSSAIPLRVKLKPGIRAAAVSGGSVYSLALTRGGQVLAWGFNGSGELGNGSTDERHIPVRVRLAKGTRVTGLFAGCRHTLALTKTGAVLAWGDNQDGELGNGTADEPDHSDVPVRVRLAKGTKVAAISVGCRYDLALTSAGKVLAWGGNQDGELGNGSSADSAVPVTVRLPAGLSAVAIGAGPDAMHSVAVVRKTKP